MTIKDKFGCFWAQKTFFLDRVQNFWYHTPIPGNPLNTCFVLKILTSEAPGVTKKHQKFIFEYLVFSQKSYLNRWRFKKVHICTPKLPYLTPSLNDKTDSGKSHLQDLARWWRTSQGVDIPKISQFYWALFEKTRFLCFYIIKSSKKRAKIEPKYP